MWADEENGSGTAAASTTISTTADDTTTPSSSRNWCRWVRIGLGLILTALFCICAYYEFNDQKLAYMWAIFYLLHAILALAATLRVCMCTSLLTLPLLILAGGMLLWSLILMAIAAADVAKTPKGGSTQGGGSDNQTPLVEAGFNLGGSLIGVLSATYYMVDIKCCTKKNNDD